MRSLIRQLEEARAAGWVAVPADDLRRLIDGLLFTMLGKSSGEVVLQAYRQGAAVIVQHAAPQAKPIWSVVIAYRPTLSGSLRVAALRVSPKRAEAEVAALAEVARLGLDVSPVQIATVRTTVGRVDEWAELTVEVTGTWPDPRTQDRAKLGQIIVAALWVHPAWQREVGRRRGQTVDVGYVGDTQGDGGPTRTVSVPLPGSMRDLELMDVDQTTARFVVTAR